MNMPIRVDIGDGPQDIQTNLWAVADVDADGHVHLGASYWLG